MAWIAVFGARILFIIIVFFIMGTIQKGLSNKNVTKNCNWFINSTKWIYYSLIGNFFSIRGYLLLFTNLQSLSFRVELPWIINMCRLWINCYFWRPFSGAKHFCMAVILIIICLQNRAEIHFHLCVCLMHNDCCRWLSTI